MKIRTGAAEALRKLKTGIDSKLIREALDRHESAQFKLLKNSPHKETKDEQETADQT